MTHSTKHTKHTSKESSKELIKVAELLIRKSVYYHDDFEMYDKAVELMGQEFVTLYKVENNLFLWKKDYDFLKRLILEQIERIDRILSE